MAIVMLSDPVVYMDPGSYRVVINPDDTGDIRDFTIGANTVSIVILADNLLVGEEGVA